MSWMLEVTTDGYSWAGNALRFGTPEEAKGYGDNLFLRWTAVRDTRITSTVEPVTHRWDRDNQRAEELASSPPQPIEPNSLRYGTPIVTHDGDRGEVADNKRGIRRMLHLNSEFGSAYIDRLKMAFVDGVWRPVIPTKDQQRKLKAVHKALADLR